MEDYCKFTPTILADGNAESFGIMVVHVHKCKTCHMRMVFRPRPLYWQEHLFPILNELQFDEQLKRAGWVEASRSKVDGKYVCMPCEAAGKVTVLCAMCGERRTEWQDSFGDPAEYLCKVCYETVPAKQYQEKEQALSDSHKYDFC